MLSNDIQATLAETAAALARADGAPRPAVAPGFRARILRALYLLRAALFPHIFAAEALPDPAADLGAAAEELSSLLSEIMPDAAQDAREALLAGFFAELPAIRETLRCDVQAAYEGDPAARSGDEIMLTYPAFEAISVYRLANALHTRGVPLIPRVMTEYAHKNTGIDIHPGATIGRYFFIDHGTGVVIGETCRIGDHVKLYQGVTLGAKSFELDADGNPVKGIKRHPDIGNRVVVYANATILGGDTHIGDGCVIGGNVWLTHSVPAGETVYYHGGQ